MFKKLFHRYYINTALIEKIEIEPRVERHMSGDYSGSYTEHYYETKLTMSSGKEYSYNFETEKEAEDFVFSLNHGEAQA